MNFGLKIGIADLPKWRISLIVIVDSMRNILTFFACGLVFRADFWFKADVTDFHFF